MPANVFRYSGIATPIAISKILGSSPMPNQTMNTGIRPNSGSVRSICMSGSTAFSPRRLSPALTASTIATMAPQANPTATRSSEIEHVALERAVGRRAGGDQRDRRAPDLGRRRQLVRRDQARRADELPAGQHDDRADQPRQRLAVQQPAAQATASGGGRCGGLRGRDRGVSGRGRAGRLFGRERQGAGSGHARTSFVTGGIHGARRGRAARRRRRSGGWASPASPPGAGQCRGTSRRPAGGGPAQDGRPWAAGGS